MLIYMLVVFFNIPANTQSKGQANTFKEDEEVYMAVVLSDKQAALF